MILKMKDMNKKKNKKSFDIFLEGELVDLCSVNEEEIDNGRWVSWFNNIKELQNSSHGVFPNNRKIQKEILSKFLTNEEIGLFIVSKKGELAGIISLSNIDRFSGIAHWGLMIAEPTKLPYLTFAALESVALIAEHGFKELGLKRIYGGQAYPELKGWNKMLEIIGFITEGYEKYGFRRGHKHRDYVKISIIYDDYKLIVKKRGALWVGLKQMKKKFSELPKKSFAEKLINFWEKERKDHFKKVF